MYTKILTYRCIAAAVAPELLRNSTLPAADGWIGLEEVRNSLTHNRTSAGQVGATGVTLKASDSGSTYERYPIILSVLWTEDQTSADRVPRIPRR
jgi:hypothetical protein